MNGQILLRLFSSLVFLFFVMRRYAFFDCVHFCLMICRVMYDIGPSQFGSVCRIMNQKVPTYIIYEINSPPSHQTLILWMNRFSSTACRPPLNPCGGRRGNKGRGSGRMMVKTGSRRKGGLWPPPFLFACFARFARKKMEGGRELVEIYFLFIKRVFCKDHDCFSSVFLIED